MYKFVRFSKGVTHTDAVYLSDYMSLRWISDSARLTALQASLKADGFDTTVHAVALPRSVFGVLIGKDPEAK